MFSAFEKDFGSIWDMNAACSQVLLNDDHVVTPRQGSPNINSLGWEEIYLHSLRSDIELPSFYSRLVCSSCRSSWF